VAEVATQVVAMFADRPHGHERRVRVMLVIGLLVGALLVGCGGDDEEPQNGGQQPEGAVEGTGYSFVPPDGWRDASEALEGSAVRIDAAYAEPDPQDGFANNVNVIRESPGGLDPDRFDEYVEELRSQAGTLATDAGLTATEELELDGEPARTWNYESRRPEQPRIRQQQVVAIHEDALYTLTWSARRDTFEDSRAELQQLLDSWRWSSR
jgi:hypothetical protein